MYLVEDLAEGADSTALICSSSSIIQSHPQSSSSNLTQVKQRTFMHAQFTMCNCTSTLHTRHASSTLPMKNSEQGFVFATYILHQILEYLHNFHIGYNQWASLRNQSALQFQSQHRTLCTYMGHLPLDAWHLWLPFTDLSHRYIIHFTCILSGSGCR